MKLTWPQNNFISKELYAPFVVKTDYEYYNDLRNKYLLFLKQAKMAGADRQSIQIISKYKDKILEAVRCYYRAEISKANSIVKHLISDIGDTDLAVNTIENSYAFPGIKGQELQLFRCRLGNPSVSYVAKDMLYIPEKMRAFSGNYRFSIPGNPSLYLSNTSYGCWIETGYPVDSEFNVSPVVTDGSQKIFNLAVSIRDFTCLNEFEESRVHCWIKLLMLNIATSYRVIEQGRTFKSEYVISQAIMMACKMMGYDGVAYYSKRVTDEIFSFCAINLALFVNYKSDKSDIAKHVKIDDSFNYSLYKKLMPSLLYKEYELRSVQSGFITNIGNYDRQYPYRETDFYCFDKFLFSSWRDKPNGKGKDEIPWGIALT